MASKAVRAINRGYHARYARKRAKGQGIYAAGSPGTPNGVHVMSRPGVASTCACGKCNAR